MSYPNHPTPRPPERMEENLLEWVLRRTPADRLREALKTHDFQMLYEAHEKQLLREFFIGSRLRMSVEMARLFRPYHTQTYAGEVVNLEMKLKTCQRIIRQCQREHRPDAEHVAEANRYIARLNELYQPGNELIKLHRKLWKSKLRESLPITPTS